MKIVKGFLIVALILIISASMSVGMLFSASGGNAAKNSATTVGYAATKEDYASQHLLVQPIEGTISNAFSGSGSLPYASLSVTDGSKGASVYRVIDGKPGTTKWTYNWNTYFPTSSVYGQGVGIWLSLSASKAYGIYAGGSASNSEGDYASANTYIGPMYTGTTSVPYDSSISGYYVNPVAYSSMVSANQKATSASSSGIVDFYNYAYNYLDHHASSEICTSKGTVTNPVATTTATGTSASSKISASLINVPYSNSIGYVSGYASNPEGDLSQFQLSTNYGKIGSPSITSTATGNYADTTASASYAYGKTTEIHSQGLDTALGYQEHWEWNSAGYWDRIKTEVDQGEGDFAAKRTNNVRFSNFKVKTYSTKDDVVITATGFGTKTALILDPRRWEFVNDVGGDEIRDTVMDSLMNKGYAVTYYSDSAVSKDKVKQMDDYWVSAICTHANSYGIYLSKSTDGYNWDTMSATELKTAYTKNNGMSLLVGCDSFLNTGSGTWADALSKAKVRGGTTSEWAITYCRDYLNNFFTYMGSGHTVAQSDDYAAGASNPHLLFFGDTTFKL